MEKNRVIFLLGLISGLLIVLFFLAVFDNRNFFITWDIFITVFLVLGITLLVLKKKYLDEERFFIKDDDHGVFGSVSFKKTLNYETIKLLFEEDKVFSSFIIPHIKDETLSGNQEEREYVVIFSKKKDFIIKDAEEFGLSQGFKKAFWTDLIAFDMKEVSLLCPNVSAIFASGTEFFEHGGKMHVYKKNNHNISAFFRDAVFDYKHALLMEVEKQKTPIISVDI